MQPLELKKPAVDLTDLAIGIVVLGIVVSVGANVLINVRNTNTSGDTAYNLADDAAVGLAEYGNWFKTIVIVGVAGLVLAILFMAFGGRSGSTSDAIGGSY